MKPSLVIICEKIVFSDPLPGLWKQLAGSLQVPSEEIAGAWKAEMRDSFLCGRLPEGAIWQWIGERFGADPALWREVFWQGFYPLASVNMIGRLSRYADVHLVSEMRAEWLEPLLRAEGLLPWISSSSFSSQMRLLLPELLAVPAPSRAGTIVVSRHESETVRRLGYLWIRSDDSMNWLAELLRVLSGEGAAGLLVPSG